MRRFILILILLTLVESACADTDNDSASDLPVGDITRGAALFTQSIEGAPACSSCHTVDGTPLVGPSFQGYRDRKRDISAEDYTYTSIIRPATYVVRDFSNVMYSQYRQRLTDQQIADLIAYLLSL